MYFLLLIICYFLSFDRACEKSFTAGFIFQRSKAKIPAFPPPSAIDGVAILINNPAVLKFYFLTSGTTKRR
jgi:hypothetical protein